MKSILKTTIFACLPAAALIAAISYFAPLRPSQPEIVRRQWRCDDPGMTFDKAQSLLKAGATYLDNDKDGDACEFLLD